MPEDPSLRFDGYRLDMRNACVWRGPQALHLTPKAFTVLRYLVEHAGQLVTRDALLQAAWPDLTVSDAALTLCIGEIRKALCGSKLGSESVDGSLSGVVTSPDMHE